ncbi:MAG: CheR family methyltransferase [Thermodesulfobacteriota bacterium]|nr:CheR family methyltransferase [Thermodesulfobacteriota bacterium]
MSLKIIESLLEKKIGLSPDAVGPDTIAKAIRRRMNDCGLSDSKAYLACLRTSKQEWEELTEAVVVPETWFFRNKESFDFLGGYVKENWLPENKGRVLRVLSIASSTGEEPYSIVMCLMNAGLPQDCLYVDATDISNRALDKAKQGLYGQESFRGKDLWFRSEYFERTADGYQIGPTLRSTVNFLEGNLLDAGFLVGEAPYDIIFCRNLLIYLSLSARKQAMQVVDRLLVRTGILFVGHAERPSATDCGFEWICRPGVFAFRRQADSPKPWDRVKPGVPLRFERGWHKTESSSGTGTAGTGQAILFRNANVANSVPPPQDRRKPSNKEVTLLDEARRLADEGFLVEAIDLCDKCLKEKATQVQGHFLKGLICLAVDDETSAEECLNKTLYLDPNHQDALDYLALIAESRGDLEKAEHLRQRVQRVCNGESGQ